MRELGVQRLVASCLNDACRHVALTARVREFLMGDDRNYSMACGDYQGQEV
jgi:hypothetical protein